MIYVPFVMHSKNYRSAGIRQAVPHNSRRWPEEFRPGSYSNPNRKRAFGWIPPEELPETGITEENEPGEIDRAPEARLSNKRQERIDIILSDLNNCG